MNKTMMHAYAVSK